MSEFHTGDLKTHIIKLSYPMVIGNLLLNIAAAFELFLVGKISLEALAAYSIALSSILALWSSVHGALINGALALVSRKCGAREQKTISEALPGMLAFGMILFVAFGIISYALLGPTLVFFGAKAEVYTLARGYMNIMLLTCLFMTFYSVMLGTARGAGDSMTPLKIVGVLMFLNVALDLVLIVFLKMGIRGAAISGVASYAGGAICYIYVFRKGINGIKLDGFKWNTPLFKTYAELTTKSMVQNFTGDIGNMAMLKVISMYGNPFIAAFGIVSRLVNFLMQFGWPISNSGGVIVGQNLGGRKNDRAMTTVMESFKIFSWVAIPTAIAFFIFAKNIIPFFTADTATIHYGIDYLVIMAPSLVFLALGMTMQSSFTGAGSIGMPTVLNILSFIVVRFGLIAVFALFTAVREAGVYWAMSLSIVFYGIINLYFYLTKKWMNKEI